MITLQELCLYLNELLKPPFPLDDYCINGLQVEGKKEIRKIGTAVSINLETLIKAKEENIDALIVHHGLFWNRDSHAIVGKKKEKIKFLLDADISLIAYHLPLDMHRSLGNNWRVALDLGWQNLMPFCKDLGVQGSFDPIKKEEFQKLLENYYEHSAKVVFGGKEKISTAAIVSGGGHKFIEEAIEQGVDCLITGTFDEPTFHQALEGQINFMALGHSATERVGPMALCQHLKEHFGIDCVFLDIFNPF